MKKVLKQTPFGYRSAKELFEKLVVVKFNKLMNSDDMNDYYDFIFSTGALRDWIILENKLDASDKRELFYDNKYISIFHSIYNNCKHFKLEMEEKYIRYYIDLDGETIKGKIIDGRMTLNYDTPLNYNSYLVDKISGVPGDSFFFCRVVDKNGNREYIFLYEICKKVFDSYKNVVNFYYSD